MNAGSLDGSAECATAPLVTYTNGGWNATSNVFTPASGNPVTDGVQVGMWFALYADGATTPAYGGRVLGVSVTTITQGGGNWGTEPATLASGMTMVIGGAWKGPNGTDGHPLNVGSDRKSTRL